jgi:hypothetical protein
MWWRPENIENLNFQKHEGVRKMQTSLTIAIDHTVALAHALQTANQKATPTESLLILPLIADTVQIQQQLLAIREALGE